MGRRLVGLDTAKGFGIFLMILVHLFSHQVARANSELFVPVLSQMSPMMLIFLSPLIFFGTMGSAFTIFTCLSTTLKMYEIGPQNRRGLRKLIRSRVIIGALIMFADRILRNLLNHRYTDGRYYTLGTVSFNFSSSTIDSIAIVGVIVPLVVRFYMRFPKLQSNRAFIVIFSSIAFIGLVIGDTLTPLGRNLAEIFQEKGLFFPELFLSKLVWGRFKTVHTFSFGCAGAVMGYLLYINVSEKTFMKFGWFLLLVSIIIIGIAAIIDWSFLLRFANDDVPFQVQMFNIGAQVLIISQFLKYLDFGSVKRRVKAAKRTIWLRRYGIVSLSLFIVSKFPAEVIYQILKYWWGEAIDNSLLEPKMVWSVFQLALFLLLVIVMWELILRLWEKLHFTFSVEWMINLFAVILQMKKTA
ncbi:hypothetical protein ES708_19046 [subsurface metagenome]